MHSAHAYMLTCHPRVDYTCHAFICHFMIDSYIHVIHSHVILGQIHVIL